MPVSNSPFGSATFRLTLLAVPLYVLAGWALLAFVYFNTMSIMQTRVDRAILAERQRILEDMKGHGDSAAVAARIVAERGSSRLYRLGAVTNFAAPETALPPPGGFSDAKVDRLNSDHPVLARLHAVTMPDGTVLVLGRDLSEEAEFRRVIEETLGIAVVLTVLLATMAGIATSRWVLRRLGRVNRTATGILHGSLEARFPLSRSGDEFDNLAQNLNEMLDRIVELMQATRQVTDNIAHDLRSPLSRIRNRLELALLPGTDRAEHEETIGACLDDTDRVLDTFEALLTIARLDHGVAPDFQPVELQDLVVDLVDYFQPLAEEKGLSIELGGCVPMRAIADPHLLFQALSNIADNAIRYTPKGGHIRAGLRQEGEFAVLSVADDGPGIPENKREQVLKRFVRLDASRHQPGTGLGLSVVDAVVRHHHGRLVLADNHPGLRMDIVLAAVPLPKKG